VARKSERPPLGVEPQSDPEPDAEDEPEGGDDEALSWAGDDLRGGIDPLTRNRVNAARLDDDDEDLGDPDAEAEAPRSIARAAASVVFAVLYLGVVVGWTLSAQITGSSATDVFSQVAWQFGEFVAIISGALWYLAVFTLTPESRTLVRVGWFALGVGVLVPWPILLTAGG
jgi:hypothetical protein